MNPKTISNFGDYLDRLEAQPSVEQVEAHLDDWPGGRKSRDSLISYVKTHFSGKSVLYRWACWAQESR